MTARILLVPGFWLGAWAWDAVAADLRGRGHEVRALTLPGLDPDDPDRLSATFERQAAAIVAAATEPTVLVSHSGGAAPSYLATDIAPERFSRTIYVDTAPLPDGHVLIPTLSPDVREFRMPSWPELEANGSSLADLDDAMLSRFRDRAVSEPIAIATAPLRLSNSPRPPDHPNHPDLQQLLLRSGPQTARRGYRGPVRRIVPHRCGIHGPPHRPLADVVPPNGTRRPDPHHRRSVAHRPWPFRHALGRSVAGSRPKACRDHTGTHAGIAQGRTPEPHRDARRNHTGTHAGMTAEGHRDDRGRCRDNRGTHSGTTGDACR
ncbi:alpha/beta hydrolase [Nocardia terpenica]|uniref:alpha/beta hydrolase n=1 Tax=Nocardia terpenica TaxID=455432 RepID=UPI001E5A8074|nr:alpha/beta hydrolase [Nocardia terpenica]